MTVAPELRTTPSAAAGPAPRGSRRGRRLAGVVAGSLVAGSLAVGLGSAAPAGAGETIRYERLQICDATACLHSWRVVDSDGDGVSDADELMAGSDPHDAASRPRMATIAELLVARQLPSFEAGLAAFVVMPPELVALREQAAGGGRLEALSFDGFPVKGRGETLSRLGISTDVMAEHGVDPGRTGFTIGLEHTSKDDGGMPPIRVGGVDITTISFGSAEHGASTEDAAAGAEKDHTPVPPDDDLEPLKDLPFGGEVGEATTSSGGVVTEFKDGTTIVSEPTWGATFDPDGGVVVEWTVEWDKKYVNPDADGGTTIDPAAFAAWERTVLGASLAVEGWAAPTSDDGPSMSKGTLVMWVDSELALGAFVAYDEPRVTSAQPEVRGDLPSPKDAAPKGAGTGPKPAGDCPFEGRC